MPQSLAESEHIGGLRGVIFGTPAQRSAALESSSEPWHACHDVARARPFVVNVPVATPRAVGKIRSAVSTSPNAVVKLDLGARSSGEKRPTVFVEAHNVNPEQPVGIGKAFSFDGLAESIEAIAERMTAALDKVKPDRAAVEFGLDVGVESGALTALLVKGTGTATVKVTLEWERDHAVGAGG
jgi:Trypsin-co-occurring domain 1